MTNPNSIIVIWLTLVSVSVITRLGPLVIGKWLKKQTWITPLATQLPLMILILLLFHIIEDDIMMGGQVLLANILGLASSLAIHYWKKQSILSISIGVIVYILVMYF